MSVTEILQALTAPSPAERARVKALSDSLSDEPQPRMTEDEIERYLAARGVASIPDRYAAPDLEEEPYEPVIVGGTPLSRAVIEERR